MKDLLSPKSVAIIGASESSGKVGAALAHNLIHSTYKGEVFPINPKRSEIFGRRAYPSIGSVPGPVDLVVIATPSKTVPGIVRECAEANVKNIVIVSAGFKELGPPGIALEEEILAIAKKGSMRIVGPNCLGIMNPHLGLNASFAHKLPLAGSIAFISQSGALCTAVLDRSETEAIGFSTFISIGSMLDVDWGDLINYCIDDPKTKSIFLYMETIGDAPAFLEAAKKALGKKPIIILKAGKTDEAAAAAASHTGSLTGSDAAISAAFEQVGAVRADTIRQFFDFAQLLAKQPQPKGNHLTIITNAGGPGVLTTDALIESGGKLATLDSEMIHQLDVVLPEHWSHSNPVDILGDANAKTYEKALELLAHEKQSDGLLVILTPQDMTDATGTAEHLAKAATKIGKPVLASWLGGAEVAKGKEVLKASGIASFDFPDDAARTFALLSQEPPPEEQIPQVKIDRAKIDEIFAQAKKEGRTLLTEFESKEVLAAAGIPTVQTYVANSCHEAVSLAERVGYPVVLKLLSETITHKTDVGGVQLNLKDQAAVEKAYTNIENAVAKADFGGVTVQKMVTFKGTELIFGSTCDPQLGPVVLFGAGGVFVEVFKDSALGLAPMGPRRARTMIERTKIFRALEGARGAEGVDLKHLTDLLVNFAALVSHYPCIQECDINPLIASSEGILALDGRIVIK